MYNPEQPLKEGEQMNYQTAHALAVDGIASRNGPICRKTQDSSLATKPNGKLKQGSLISCYTLLNE